MFLEVALRNATSRNLKELLGTSRNITKESVLICGSASVLICRSASAIIGVKKMDIRLIKTERVLARTQIRIADYVINPYRGCLFGCAYCYSSANKTAQHKEWGDFLEVKINAPDVLEEELQTITPGRVLLGSTTECFQYPELKYKITGTILEKLNRKNIPYTILTRSDTIAPYLSVIQQNPSSKLYFTVGSDEQLFKHAFEPRSPSFSRRLQVLKEIAQRHIPLRIHLSPVLPFLFDFPRIFRLISGLTREVGIEFYNAKMGPALFAKALATLPDAIQEKIKGVYSDRESYTAYFNDLKEEIRSINNDFNYTLFFVMPEFDTYYGPTIVYE